MQIRRIVLIITALLIVSACNLSAGPAEQEPIDTLTPVATGRPEVEIESPESGDEVVINEDIFVSATVSDSVGVTRVQLIANGQIVKTVSSESPTGDRTNTFILDYRPRTTGDVTLEVIAYRNAVASDPAEVEIQVRANEAQVTATVVQQPNVPIINPNDPTCRALTNAGLNLRTGPGTQYPRITVLGAGTVVPIQGRLGNNTWWQVRVNTTIGWVSAAYTTVYGNCGGIPVIAPPVPPTIRPSATFTRTHTPIPNQPTATHTLTRTPGPPDLVISSISGEETLDMAGGSGVTGNYTVQITNTGASSTGQFSTTLTIQPDDQVIELGVVANLGAGESIVLTRDIIFSSTGSYTLQVRTDSDNQVTEQSEVNNIGIFEVTVTNLEAVEPEIILPDS